MHDRVLDNNFLDHVGMRVKTWKNRYISHISRCSLALENPPLQRSRLLTLGLMGFRPLSETQVEHVVVEVLLDR